MTLSGPVGLGVIGAGVISTRYLENLTTFPDVKVLFIADLDEVRAAQQAKKFGVGNSGTTAQLLAHPGVELVVNLTVPAVHVDVAMQALAAGKHVFTEKPFALDRVSGLLLLEKAKGLGLRVATAPDTFLGAGLQAGRRLIDEGRIGTPVSALTLFQVAGPESWHPSPDFLYAEGAGPLFDMGPYYLTALIQNLGPVSRVAATTAMSRTTRVIGSGPRAGERFAVEVPTHVSALIEFEKGATAQSIFSFESHRARAGFVEFSGSEATLVFPDPNNFGGELTLHVAGAEPVTTVVAATESRGIGVVELARAIRAGVPERASGEQAFHVLDVMVSIIEAAQQGTFVDVASTTTIAPALPADWDPRAATL